MKKQVAKVNYHKIFQIFQKNISLFPCWKSHERVANWSFVLWDQSLDRCWRDSTFFKKTVDLRDIVRVLEISVWPSISNIESQKNNPENKSPFFFSYHRIYDFSMRKIIKRLKKYYFQLTHQMYEEKSTRLLITLHTPN